MGDGVVPDEAKVRKDLLWGMYADLRAHARHAETLRANVTSVVVAIAAALVAVITNDGSVQRGDLAMSGAIVVVGLFGVAFAASYTELYERNRRRAMRFRAALDGEFFEGAEQTLTSLLDEADRPHRASALYRAGRATLGSTQRFWLMLPALVAAAGLVLTVVAL
jgi:hypothetical protein